MELKYLDYTDDQFYNEFIQERSLFSDFVNGNFERDIDIFINDISDYINNKYSDNAILWVGGSRSWYQAINYYYNTSEKFNLEKISIIPGNFDVFLISNDFDILKNIMCYIYTNFVLLVNKFKDEYKNSYVFTYNKRNIIDMYDRKTKERKCFIQQPEEICTLFKCQSIFLSLKSVKRSKRKIQQDKDIDTQDRESQDIDVQMDETNALTEPNEIIEMETTNVTRDDMDIDINKISDLNEPLFPDEISVISENDNIFIKNYKLLMYIESGYIPNININEMKKLLLFKSENNFKRYYFLNPNGIFLFSEFIKNARKEKGLNVDMYRKNMIRRIISQTENLSLSKIYKYVLDMFLFIFPDDSVFEQKINKHNYIKSLITSIINSDAIETVNDNIGKLFISKIRPYINSFLIAFSRDLEKEFGDQVFMCVVGGDALRRYQYNITETSDIDTKVFVNSKFIKNKKNKLKLVDFIISRLSHFTIYLEMIKTQMIKNDLSTIGEKENIKYKFNLLQNIAQFRLRYIDSTLFPVDLFSIDFRTFLYAQYQNINYTIPIDISFLDIVIHNNEEQLSENFVINQQNPVPIASIEYIMHDMKKTYNNKNMASGRFWSGKISKDKIRYEKLKDIIKNGSYISMIEKEILNYHFEDPVYNLVSNDEINMYINYFKKIIQDDIKNKKYKHKMPFKDILSLVLK